MPPPKRKSFLDQLAREQAPPEPARLDAPPSNTNTVPVAAPKPPSDKIKSSLYLPPAVQDRLREIAFTERKKIHDLFLEGIDLVIESRGHPERARPKSGA